MVLPEKYFNWLDPHQHIPLALMRKYPYLKAWFKVFTDIAEKTPGVMSKMADEHVWYYFTPLHQILLFLSEWAFGQTPYMTFPSQFVTLTA